MGRAFSRRTCGGPATLQVFWPFLGLTHGLAAHTISSVPADQQVSGFSTQRRPRPPLDGHRWSDAPDHLRWQASWLDRLAATAHPDRTAGSTATYRQSPRQLNWVPRGRLEVALLHSWASRPGPQLLEFPT